jgi:hypothetical protein
MEVTMKSIRYIICCCVVLSLLATTGFTQDIEDLAKKAQNPVSDLIAVPIEHNFNFDVGMDGDIQHVTVSSPVLPVKLNKKWILINRAIIPAIYQPLLAPGVGDEFGLGDINFTTFLSPRETSSGTTWGVGPSLTIPSASNEVLGTEKWLLGPAFVVFKDIGSWSTGLLISNAWSIGGESDRADVNAGFMQPWFYYNFPSGAYIFYEPVITVDWEADSGERWTVPLGIGVGKITTIGTQYVNVQIAAFYNVETPTGGAEWTIRPQISFLFPK